MQHAELARIYGIVQGVGFRPTVARHAAAHGVLGSVSNKGPFVEIDAQGEKEDIEAFFDDLLHHPPERAIILKLDRKPAPGNIGKADSFEIIESAKVQGEIFVSPDIAICDKCKKEMYDPSDRRYLHPFINCTSCGPRTTILDGMPYDRIRTSMAEFPMCPQCEYEYTHAETRRYDAQPVCCNDCGPEVYLIPTDGSAKLPVDVKALPKWMKDGPAITGIRRIVSSGGIVAIKGIGGFHLCCDATNQEAVQRLRDIKPRPAKPFAVMMKDLETVRRECIIEPYQEEILDGHQKPIILLPKRLPEGPDGSEIPMRSMGPHATKLASGIAPGNPAIGVMLPYAPVQLLLFDYPDGIVMPDCLVMTSGNVSGAAICRNDEDAVRELSRMCDMILSHNRLIRLRADDSVMDFHRGKPYMIRRSRGYAPLPFMLDMPCEGSVLAAGGELKNTFCVARNHLFYPSPYIGDTADIRTVNALKESIKRMCDLLEAKPEIAACDKHPGYNTTAVAHELGLPVLEIQHHYAHIASCLAENNRTDRVIGVSFDGTGYGDDGTIWGGEYLTADLDSYERAGHISPFLQIGGDVSSKEGWRIAVSMIYSASADKTETEMIVSELGLCSDQELKFQFMMADKQINSVRSTSAGRLFDAVSAVLGIKRLSTFEGEASTSLQYAAEEWSRDPGKSWYSMQAGMLSGTQDEEVHTYEDGTLLCKQDSESGAIAHDTQDLFMWIVKERLAGRSAKELAWEFHQALADGIVETCCFIRGETGIAAVALSGGVFQNRLLLRMCEDGLKKHGFEVLIHSMVPPNDGGICLGQAAVAMRELLRRKGLDADVRDESDAVNGRLQNVN
ncbi:MAG: carbamoyltransferase HypF [Mogibacterium sp.]|nr:carbamoyltransferase HypF [Mogibacterium sp.]